MAGLINKYLIRKTNGNPMHAHSKYFVLRYDHYGKDPIHIKACQKALRTYAEEIKEYLPELYIDLIEELKLEENEQNKNQS